MKCRALFASLLLATGGASAQFPPQIKNIIVIVQENRTPDNLFHALTPACAIPAGATGLNACRPSPVTNSCYDVSPCGISNATGTPVSVTLTPVDLAGSVDPDHSHGGFLNMCDQDPTTFQCRNDGAYKTSKPAGSSYAYVTNAPVTNSDGSAGHLLDPYLTFAKQYGWANFMYQTNQGPSFPAHQFLFAGTSARSSEDDANSTFVSENFNGKVVSKQAGCLAPAGSTNSIISPTASTPRAPECVVNPNGSQECPIANDTLVYPTQPVGVFCNDKPSMASLLDPANVTWKYYAASPGSIWSAPDSIKNICQPAYANPNGDPTSALVCSGAEWNANVDTKNNGTDILRDIASCNLSNVSWVIPDGAWSDHAGGNDLYGPSWVAAVINAVGNNPKCASGTAAGQTYWQNTAIVVTWDDWGGWSDNEPARILSALPCTTSDCQGDYQYGFRVPMLVVSAYTPAGTINNVTHDFGSILRMIEGVNHLQMGQLGVADKRATGDLRLFFPLTQPRTYTTVPAQMAASFFLNYKKAPLDPDDN